MNNLVKTGSGSNRFENKVSNEFKINVRFPVHGQKLHADHGYLLYSAISKLLPALHETGWLCIELISGVPFDKGLIVLPTRGASLNLRIPADKFGDVLPLAGKRLEIDGHTIRLGIPLARPLLPAPWLYARMVTFKNSMEPDKFLKKVRKEIETLGIKAVVEFPSESLSRHRRILTIESKNKPPGSRPYDKIVGFSLIAHDLSDEDSIKLQSIGLGGRRAMGCGIFNPILKTYDFDGGDNAV